MAHIWIHRKTEGWVAVPLVSEYALLIPGAEPQVRNMYADAPDDGAITLKRVESEPLVGKWVLVAPSGAVQVNGYRLLLGIRVLRERDQIRLPGGCVVYFSTERPAKVEPYPGGSTESVCPRCRQQIVPGTDAVQCPKCEVWHHQTTELPCWTYAETCALCPQRAVLDGELEWSPEQL